MYSYEEVLEKLKIAEEALKRHFVRDYLYDGEGVPYINKLDIAYVNEEYLTHFKEGVFQGIFIELNNLEETSCDMAIMLDRTLEMIKELVDGFCYDNAHAMWPGGIMILLNYSEEKRDSLLDMVVNIYKKVSRYVELFPGLKVTIGVGEEADCKNAFSSSIMTSRLSAKYRMNLADIDIIDYKRHSYAPVFMSDIMLPDEQKKLESCAANGNYEGARKIIAEACRRYYIFENLSPDILYHMIDWARKMMLRLMEDDLKEHFDRYYKQYYSNIDTAMQPQQLWDIMSNFVDDCIKCIDDHRKNDISRPIRAIKEYIDVHYMDQISLDMVSDEVQLSPNYVSAVFKKELGVSFVEYLTSKRMDEAVSLMQKSDMSINELAGKVGYSDAKYFSKIFKKHFGMKPSEYRKLYS